MMLYKKADGQIKRETQHSSIPEELPKEWKHGDTSSKAGAAAGMRLREYCCDFVLVLTKLEVWAPAQHLARG